MKKILFFVMIFYSVSVFGSESEIERVVNNIFGVIVDYFGAVLFWRPPIIQLPLVLCVMVAGGIYYTIRFRFINVRLFRHSIDVIRGKYDNPESKGEISHFQALTSALSATVGLGNIAGVAIAIQLGGPGAVFWLWIVAFMGMSMKFTSCTFGQLYRHVDKNGVVLGGPMVYLRKGYREHLNLPTIGKILGTGYAIFLIFGVFGGGNLFQANQAFELLAGQFPVVAGYPLVVGSVMAFFAGIVLIGGIKRIGEVTSRLVPLMVVFYCGACLMILFSNFSMIPDLFISIFKEAFSPDAIYSGGFIGVLIQGVKRASFSNESGVGTAAIAHAAAKTDEPIREGVVAMIGPFIDTHVICTMTSLAILITGAHLDPTVAGKGAQITALAFSSIGSFMPILLTLATILFAYSTMISYSYYGERAIIFLFGKKCILPFRIIYVLLLVIGPVLSLGKVIDFTDLMILSLAFFNIVGMAFLVGKVRPMAKDYYSRYKSGQMKTYK